MKLYITNENKGIKAIAEYTPSDKRFIVLKGSEVSYSVSKAPTFRGAKAILALREKYVVERIVQENVTFKSSSTAGNFVTGYSTDGPSTWKDETGQTLKALNEQTKG